MCIVFFSSTISTTNKITAYLPPLLIKIRHLLLEHGSSPSASADFGLRGVQRVQSRIMIHLHTAPLSHAPIILVFPFSEHALSGGKLTIYKQKIVPTENIRHEQYNAFTFILFLRIIRRALKASFWKQIILKVLKIWKNI